MSGGMQRGGLRAEREKMQGGSHQFLRMLHAIEKPVIAAVRGPTVGIGWSIALACDLIVASETARFSQIFRRIGLAPDGGAIWFLTRRIGMAKAKELVFTARFVEAPEALSLGSGKPCRAGRRADGEDRGIGGGPGERVQPSHLGMAKKLFHMASGTQLRGLPGHGGLRAAAVRPDRGPPRRRCRVQREAEAEFRRTLNGEQSRHILAPALAAGGVGCPFLQTGSHGYTSRVRSSGVKLFFTAGSQCSASFSGVQPSVRAMIRIGRGWL